MSISKIFRVGLSYVIVYGVKFLLQYFLFNLLVFIAAISVFFVLFSYINFSQSVDFTLLEKIVFQFLFRIKETDKNIDLIPIIAKSVSYISLAFTFLSLFGEVFIKLFTGKTAKFRLRITKRVAFISVTAIFCVAILSSFSPYAQIDNFWIFLGLLTVFFLFQLVSFYFLFTLQDLIGMFSRLVVVGEDT